MIMPDYEDYKYILCVVNMRLRLSDVEPLKTKTAISVLNAFKTIYERNIADKKIEFIISDQGAEFNNKIFLKFCKDNNIGISFTRVGNHKQNAIVESTNGQYKKFLLYYITYKSQETHTNYKNWLEALFIIRDEMNLINSTKYPKDINYLDMNYTGSYNPKFKYGDLVYVKLDNPVSDVANKKLFGKFRYGDNIFSTETYKIIGVNMNPGKQLRYTVQDEAGNVIYGNYLESHLLNFRNT